MRLSRRAIADLLSPFRTGAQHWSALPDRETRDELHKLGLLHRSRAGHYYLTAQGVSAADGHMFTMPSPAKLAAYRPPARRAQQGRCPYKQEWSPGHPLARATAMIYVHRRVYREAHGEGPFACHWCSKSVTWRTMHVDHVDNDPTNNAIGNLVAACPRCNTTRGRAADGEPDCPRSI